MDTEIKNFRRRFEKKFGKAMGLGSSELHKVLSSLQEVGNLPTRVYFLSKYFFGLGWALRAVWIVFSNTKIVFFSFGVVFVKLIFGLSLGRVLCHVYG